MAPSRSPKGKKNDGESVKEALERLKVATPEERAGEKASMATWTGTQCKNKLGAMGVDFTGFTDTNVLRMMLTHTLSLGVTPKSTWSPKAVKHAVREIFQQPASDKELQGKAGKDYLAKLIAEDGDEGGKINRELNYNESDKDGEDEFALDKLSPRQRKRLMEMLTKVDEEGGSPKAEGTSPD